MNKSEMVDYYARRADEYEDIYYRDDPQRLLEQSTLGILLVQSFRGRNVIEIAAGTGYWTHYATISAHSVTATDFNQEPLAVARATKVFPHPVSFAQADAYHLPFPDNAFTAGLANLWLSHVPKYRTDEFLDELHRVLQPGSPVIIADNVYIPGVGGKLIQKEEDENTYKRRELKDGTITEVVKNYPSPSELEETFGKHVSGFSKANIVVGSCFWVVSYDNPT